MKKIYIILGIASMALGIFSASAQAPVDAYRNVKNGPMGTARSQGLGGAMGAVGADPTAVYVNPAGGGLFQRNTLTLGFDLGQWNTSTEGTNGIAKNKKFLGNFNHASYFFSGSTLPLGGMNYLKLNGGISYEKEYNYNRSYSLLSGAMPGGLTDFMVFRAVDAGYKAKEYYWTDDYDPFMTHLDPIVIMGMNGEFILPFPDNGESTEFESNMAIWNSDNTVDYLLPLGSELNVSEKGGRHNVDATLSGSYNDIFYFGASLRMGNSRFSRYSMYSEDFENGSRIEYGNALQTEGATFGLNLGAMLALGDYARVGISYLTPQYAQYKELYRTTTRMVNKDLDIDKQLFESDSGELRSSYGMIMPGKLTLSAMAFIGQYGFVSYDYQYRNLGSAKLLLPNSFDESFDSQFIKQEYAGEHTHRLGLELRPMPWLSLRGGYSFTGNPMKYDSLKVDPLKEDLFAEVKTSGAIADFTLPRALSSYSAGVGLQLSKECTLDMAYVHSKREQSVYPFSGYTISDIPNAELSVRGGKLAEIRNSFVTTLVFKF